MTPEILFTCGDEIATPLEPESMPDLQTLLEHSADYFFLIEGHPPGLNAAESLAQDRPPGWSLDNKFLIGIRDRDDQLVAVIDGMRDYPDAGIFWVGLLLVDPDHRGQGLGERIMNNFERWARDQGARQVRLGVAEINVKARRFWQCIGYKPVSKSGPAYLGQHELVIHRMKKDLT